MAILESYCFGCESIPIAMSHPPAEAASGLPVVVQLAFAGSRDLYDRKHPPSDPAGFEAAIAAQLAGWLKRLPGELFLHPHHFLCGLSQIARGADLAFTRACQQAEVAQRLFLPQPLDAYLSAINSKGVPDFSAEDLTAVQESLRSPHLIHRRVVSGSEDRHGRFQETNIELLRSSDVCLCVIASDEAGSAGGTREFIEAARVRGLPILVLRIEVREGQPHLIEAERLHWPSPPVSGESARASWPPRLHGLLADVVQTVGKSAEAKPPSPGVPTTAMAFLTTLKRACSAEAGAERRRFRLTAGIVVGTHLIATLAAVLVLRLPEAWRAPLLALELVLLVGGIVRHGWHHHSRAALRGAVCRVGAEIARSCIPLRSIHAQLEHLFVAPYPEEFRPLLRTINVLHLASTRGAPGSPPAARKGEPLRALVSDYLRERLDDRQDSEGCRVRGQLSYYGDEHDGAQRALRWVQRAFYLLAGGALVGALIKLTVHPTGGIELALGAAGILLPVMAVAAISTSVAFDLEPREHTYRETFHFLERTRPVVAAATSEAEFIRLVLDTETRLLSENATWAARRSFASPP